MRGALLRRATDPAEAEDQEYLHQDEIRQTQFALQVVLCLRRFAN
jgi:hypothetical protein